MTIRIDPLGLMLRVRVVFSRVLAPRLETIYVATLRLGLLFLNLPGKNIIWEGSPVRGNFYILSINIYFYFFDRTTLHILPSIKEGEISEK